MSRCCLPPTPYVTSATGTAHKATPNPTPAIRCPRPLRQRLLTPARAGKLCLETQETNLSARNNPPVVGNRYQQGKAHPEGVLRDLVSTELP